MSHQFGQSAGLTRRVIRSKGVLVTAGVAATAVGVAFAIATPLSAFGAPTGASLASAASSSATETPLLTAQGLESLLNARFAPLASVVDQQGSTAAQQATSLLNSGSATASADGNVLTVNVPAISGITPAVQARLDPIGSQLGELSGSDGQVANAVNQGVLNINSLLNLEGPGANLTANVPFNLDAAVAPDLNSSTGSGAVSIDPQAGTVSVDLSKLLGDNSSGTATQSGWGSGSGSTVISSALDPQITADINSAASALGNNLVASASNSVENTPVNVNANLSLLSKPSSTGISSCTNVGSTSGGSTSGTTSATSSGGLLGGVTSTVNNLLGGAVSTVGGTVGNLVCTVQNLVPALLTTLSLNLGGNVGQIVEGSAPPATGSISVLGQPTLFNTGGINNGVGEAIVNNIAGTTPTSGSGSGAGSTTSTPCSSGTLLNLCLSANVNGGTGSLLNAGTLGNLNLGGLGLGGLNLGGLNLGGVLGSTGSGTTPGVLGSLLNGSDNLPLGITANVGTGGVSVGSGSGTSSGSGNLLNLNTGTGGSGTGVTVNVGGSSSGSNGSSGSGNLLNLNTGTGGSGTGGVIIPGILGVN